MTYRTEAACKNTAHPQAFAAATPGTRSQAPQIRKQFAQNYCTNCPIRQQCEDNARKLNAEGVLVTDPVTGARKRAYHPTQWGIWGGIDFTRKAKSGRQEPLPDWRERIGQVKWEQEHGYETS